MDLNFIAASSLVVLLKLVCFILGYLTIRLGYSLIVSGVKGEFKFSGKLGGLQADLASVSPGLLFVLLGVLLIGYAMFVEKGVNVEKVKKANREPQQQIVEEQDMKTPPFEDLTVQEQDKRPK